MADTASTRLARVAQGLWGACSTAPSEKKVAALLLTPATGPGSHGGRRQQAGSARRQGLHGAQRRLRPLGEEAP